MAIELVIAGTYGQGTVFRRRSPERLFGALGSWWQAHRKDLEPQFEILPDGSSVSLWLRLHPAAEPAVFEAPEPGTVIVTARTSSAGPGYHRALADGLHAMAKDLDIRWSSGQFAAGTGDETGYFDGGEPGVVDGLMLDWASNVCASVLDHAADGSTGFAIAMPDDWVFLTPGFALTSLGPRDRAFVEEVANRPSSGRGLFPWWGDDLDASFYRDRALVRMWLNVRWRPPVDDDDRELLSSVNGDLERAHKMGGRELPSAAWSEIRSLIGKPSAPVPAGPAERSIGYRREPIRARVGRWTVELPGSLSETLDDDGTYVAYDLERNVRLTTLTVSGPSGPIPPREAVDSFDLDADPTMSIDDGQRVGGAAVRPAGDGEDLVTQGVMAVAGEVVLATISHRSEDVDWARRTFESLTCEPVEDRRA